MPATAVASEDKMSAEVFWLYEVAVKPGQVEALRTLMAELVESTRAEPGSLSYEWSISGDGTVAHIYERYADSAATLAHVARFRETFRQRFLAAVEPTRVVVYGTPSEDVRQALITLRPVYMSALAGFAR